MELHIKQKWLLIALDFTQRNIRHGRALASIVERGLKILSGHCIQVEFHWVPIMRSRSGFAIGRIDTWPCGLFMWCLVMRGVDQIKVITSARHTYRAVHAVISPPLDNMAAILADDIFKWICLNENDRPPIQISLKCVPRNPIGNKSALVQVMAWRRTGDKPLPEPMMTQFTDAYMRHWGEMSYVAPPLVAGWYQSICSYLLGSLIVQYYVPAYQWRSPW